MKLYLLILFVIISSYSVQAQMYGNSVQDTYGGFSDGYTTFWRIHTGSSDSGEFTHLGVYIHPDNYSDIITMGLYSSFITPIKPKDLLGTVGYPNVTDGAYNEFPFGTNITLAPDTDYFIAIKGEYLIKGGRESGANWGYPAWYYASWFFGGFPNSAPSSLSAIGNPNNQAIYVIANSTGLLPITLSYFNAEEHDNEIMLYWETSSEINNEGWNIQKTTNGFTYETIGWVDGKRNSSSFNKYEFKDINPSAGINIYRLEQVDLDGEKSYSEHRTVSFENKDLSIFPNPVSNVLNIKGEIKTGIEIFDINGELVFERKHAGKTIDLSDILAGSYFVKINNQVLSFIKVD